jgi:hypothetical protein
MKSFSQLLTEAPIADDDFEKYSETPKDESGVYKKDLTLHTSRLFGKKYEEIGNGSSRVVVQCDVPVKLFNKEHRLQHKLNKAGYVKTAIKIAKNPEGIQQNTAELKFWKELQHLPFGKYLCPVLDWSGNPVYKNNSQYTLDINTYEIDINMDGDLKGALWIQMPFVEPAEYNIEKFMDAFNRTFGPINLPVDELDLVELDIEDDEDMDEQGLQTLMCLLNPTEFPTMHQKIVAMRDELFDAGEISEEQEQAMTDLITLRSQFHMCDFGHVLNWGLLKGRPVILDYGYNEETAMIYQYTENVDFGVYVDHDGTIRIKYAEEEPNYNK